MSTVPDVQTRRWKRVEYERMVECGIFRPDERLELIDGLLILREPQSSPHMTATRLVQEALRTAFGPGWDVRPQGPVALDDDSEPEPDVSVVPGGPRDYTAAHPSHAVLVVEVSLTSLAFDRADKSSLYARAGVADYWIVNLVDRVVEVRRGPVPSDAAPFGWTYATLEIAGPDDSVTALAAPRAPIAVRDLLP
jgi:Uma2 family endonuclease